MREATNTLSSVWFFRLLSMAVICLCLLLRAFAGGWWFLGLSLFGPYAAIAVVHLWLTARRVPSPKPFPGPLARAILISHLFLIAAALLQWDEGDAPCGWITIRKLLWGAVDCQGDFWDRLSLPSFAPVVASWFWIWMLRRREDKRSGPSNPEATKRTTLSLFGP